MESNDYGEAWPDVQEDGLYVGGKRIDLTDRDTVRRESLLTQQQMGEVAQQAQAMAHQQLVGQTVQKALHANPDVAQHGDLLTLELQQIPDDFVHDPYGEQKISTAIQRVRSGLSRLDSMTMSQQRGAHQQGLSLTPDGRLIEGESLGNPQVEESDTPDLNYKTMRTMKVGNIKKTYSKTGVA